MTEADVDDGRWSFSTYWMSVYWVVALVVLIAVIAALWLALVGVPKNPTTVKQVEERVRKGVPPRSTRQQVEAWLKSQSIEHGYHDKPANESSVQDAKLSPDDISGIVEGIIRDTDRGPYVEGSISIYFFFDKNSRTMKHMVMWGGTGP